MQSETPQQDEQTGRFLAGNNLSTGRPKGARAKLGEAFLEALQKDFDDHGAEAIVKTRETKPEVYVKVIAGLLPSNVNLNVSNSDDMTDAELLERVRQLTAVAQPLLSAAGIEFAAVRIEQPARAQRGTRTPNRVH